MFLLMATIANVAYPSPLFSNCLACMRIYFREAAIYLDCILDLMRGTTKFTSETLFKD